jgi:hypothetical protein
MGVEEQFEGLRPSAACAPLSREGVTELLGITATLIEERRRIPPAAAAATGELRPRSQAAERAGAHRALSGPSDARSPEGVRVERRHLRLVQLEVHDSSAAPNRPADGGVLGQVSAGTTTSQKSAPSLRTSGCGPCSPKISVDR